MKSKVACETCGTESVRFDPFSLLSLPLPVENFTYCEVLVTKLDGSCPVKYGIRLNSECKYWDLKNQLAPMSGVDPKSLLLCQLEGSQIKCILANETKINANSSHSLYAYELPKNENERSRTGSEVVNIEKGLKDIQRNQGELPGFVTRDVRFTFQSFLHTSILIRLTFSFDFPEHQLIPF